MKQHVIKEVNRIFNCDIFEKNRKQNNVSGRVAFSYYMRLKSNLKLREIGKLFNQSPYGIYRNTKVHENFLKYDSDYRKKYLELESINPMNICNEMQFNPYSISSVKQRLKKNRLWKRK